MTKHRVCVGAIVGSYGVWGEVRLKSFCASPEDIVAYNPLTTEDVSQSFSLKITRTIKNGFAVRLTGVGTKEQADALKGTRLYAERALLPSLPDDEFYYADLIGLDVVDTSGTLLGRVKAVQNHGADDLLEIHGPGFRNTMLLPFTRAMVPTVDIRAGRIVTDPPEGLF
ncbi:MAG: 16S rRNA processing protein RimM [Rhodobacteraceae bacterium]|nr:16S rRNA processing protein RimM [Paracoccaceae bacterium]